ncbi:hypothetical protein AGMMS50225_04570 [Betaproteobacteria bacterium]|nr:hypothetical protein AGMMS50225_04570 [Betaproteobacteria bacterium]
MAVFINRAAGSIYYIRQHLLLRSRTRAANERNASACIKQQAGILIGVIATTNNQYVFTCLRRNVQKCERTTNDQARRNGRVFIQGICQHFPPTITATRCNDKRGAEDVGSIAKRQICLAWLRGNERGSLDAQANLYT